LKSFRFSGRAAVVTALVLAVGVPTTAMGFGEGRNLLLGKRNPSANSSRTLTSETEIIASNSTYGTRQSNKGSGGGAIYGCRAAAAAGAAACVRSSNLNGGQAFQFTTTGATAGRIETGNTAGAPFTTNATGVATGLNSDKLDGKDSTDFAAAADVKTLSDGLLFATVNATGTIGDNKRGALTSTKDATNPVYTVKFNRDVSKCSYTASVVGAAATTSPGVQSTAGDPTSVTVNLGGTAGNAFHLQVIC
jgi:hypothetical protein